MPQLTYTTEFAPSETGFSQLRNNDVILNFGHDMGAGTNIEEALFYLRDTDDSSVVLAITKEDNSSQWSWPEDDIGAMTILAADTKELTADANYEYGILLKDTSGRYLSPVFGSYAIINEVVHEGGQTNAPLLWVTRQALQDKANELAASAGCAFVITAASSGGTTLETSDTSDLIIAVGVTAGDDLYISTDTGPQTVLNADIDSVSGGVITLDGDTLDANVSVAKIVRLLP